MAVSGGYMAWRTPSAIIPIRAYGDFLQQDILPRFEDLSEKADAIADKEFDRLGSLPAGDDWDGDMGALAEAANDKAIEFYETMSGLKRGMYGLFAAGLFHMVEQQLAYLCHDRSFTAPPLKEGSLKELQDWYKQHFHIDLSTFPDWNCIDELRLLANTVKHAEGGSAEKLRKLKPAFFQSPWARDGGWLASSATSPIVQPLAGDNLYVTDADLKRYFDAAIRLFETLANHFENARDQAFG